MSHHTTGSRRSRPVPLALAGLVALLAATGAHAQEPAAADSLAPPAPVAATPLEAAPAPPAARSEEAPNPAATGSRKVRLLGKDRHVVRSGPGEGFAIVGVYPGGATFPADARRGDWYHLRLSDTEGGWIHASLVEEFEDMAGLEWKPNPKQYTRTGTYVFTGFSGAYAFDRKSNSLVLGGRLGYYVFDRIQAEGSVGWTRVNRPAEIVESLFGLELEAEKFDMLFYELGVLYEVLPGRQMVPFVTAGIGSAIMQGESETSVTFGAGTAMFLAKRSAVRWEFRYHGFRSGTADSRSLNSNVEFSLGTALLF